MIEVTGNLWEYPADIRCITTNGTIKKNGECVMGRGCAREAAQKWPQMPRLLGSGLRMNGNHVQWLFGGQRGEIILSFPVKHEWFEKADIDLIARSAQELFDWVNPKSNIKTVVLPRPGCGNGHLKWELVKDVIAPILDERFHVITFA